MRFSHEYPAFERITLQKTQLCSQEVILPYAMPELELKYVLKSNRDAII